MYLFILAARVKEENLRLTCVPTSFQVGLVVEDSHMAMRCPHYACTIYINLNCKYVHMYAMLNVVEK